MSSDDLNRANEPWDRRTWFARRPEDFVPGLFCFTQIQARDILRHGRNLTNWEAGVCQRAYYRFRGHSNIVRFYLDEIEREKCGQVFA